MAGVAGRGGAKRAYETRNGAGVDSVVEPTSRLVARVVEKGENSPTRNVLVSVGELDGVDDRVFDSEGIGRTRPF